MNTSETDQPTLETPTHKAIGFWGCWSLVVGIMIGSGIFMLPAVLAPYGLLGFTGWIITAGGSILLALVLGRLAHRTTRSGGPIAYAHDAFGDLVGYLVAWGYWASYWIAIPAIAIAFVGYLTVFVPALQGSPIAQAGCGLALIWGLGLISLHGIRDASFVQLLMTVLKLVPIFLIIGVGLFTGDVANLPAVNPSGDGFFPVLAATALLTMWAFAGLEAATIPAGDVRDAASTVPKATVIGTITVAIIYIAATASVMLVVPAAELVESTSPFSDAARALGSWGPGLIAAGAMVSTAGALNGVILLSGQLPMAVALDKLAPAVLGHRNKGGAPQFSLLLSLGLGSILLVANYSRGLVGAFTFLLMMSTVCLLLPLLVSALAELRHSWKSARGWAVIALAAGAYSAFAVLGSGLEVLAWGGVLILAGLPAYWLGKPKLVVET
ncbi:amino acid permease [uncultured Maricaulis sp.]|uniref:amino acid permease n=1 Tax=uncultured Maricaulis sp. TaxID=174710 RepID=UPI00260A86C5|nr:amino acid permease [uncultured Maricaulis sp.]